jgi:hypothetical protein
MRDQRGFSVIEILLASLAGGIILLGLGSLYVAATRAFGEADSQASLQRQGTLALQEISRRIQSGAGSGAITTATCNGQANSVQVTTPDGTFCFYAGPAGTADTGKLCEYTVGGDGGCRDLLYGALQRRVPWSTQIALLIQPVSPSPNCPNGVAANKGCFVGAVLDPDAITGTGTTAELQFAITDGLNVMSFGTILTCNGRSCCASGC